MENIIKDFILVGKTLYERGLASGSSGNMSALLSDNLVIASATGQCLGEMSESTISFIDIDGNLIKGAKPTKEIAFHLAIYRNNPNIKAIVHLHSTYSTAYSCLDNLDTKSVFKPFTPYVVMKMGDIPLIPYYKPGSEMLALELEKVAREHNAFLLSNHGPITCGKTLKEALNNAEEFEETAKVFFTLQSSGLGIKYLNKEQVNDLRSK